MLDRQVKSGGEENLFLLLTPWQFRVMEFLAQGLRNVDIAKLMHLNATAVATAVYQIKKSTGISVRAQLAAKFAQSYPTEDERARAFQDVCVATSQRVGHRGKIQKEVAKPQLRIPVSAYPVKTKPFSSVRRPEDTLTTREFQCCAFVATGKTDGEIGEILSISGETVKLHLFRARNKVGVDNRTALAVWFVKKFPTSAMEQRGLSHAEALDVELRMEISPGHSKLLQDLGR